MRSWLTALVCIGAVAVGKGSPVQRTPTSTDALLAAIYKYNAGSGQLNLFKLMATYCIAIKINVEDPTAFEEEQMGSAVALISIPASANPTKKQMNWAFIPFAQMPQGKEYEIGFSLKQTVCTKGMEDVMQDCEYMDNGTILICNSVITIRFNVPAPTKITVSCSPQD